MRSKTPPGVLLVGGYPGAGKTTQIAFLTHVGGTAVLSAGPLLRREAGRGTSLGKAFMAYSSEGVRAPDDIVCAILRPSLLQLLEGGHEGIVSDGFPKSVPQLAFLEDLCSSPVLGMIYLDAPEEILLKRASERRHCEKCGPVRGEGETCGRCGSPLLTRYDDDLGVVRNRLRTYALGNQEIMGVMESRGTLIRVDASADIDSVREAVHSAYLKFMTR